MKVRNPIEVNGDVLKNRTIQNLWNKNDLGEVNVRKIKDKIMASDIRELPRYLKRRINKDKDLRETLKKMDENGIDIRSEAGQQIMEALFKADRQQEVVFEMDNSYYVAYSKNLARQGKLLGIGKPGDPVCWNDKFGEVRFASRDKHSAKPILLAAGGIALGVAVGLALNGLAPAVVPNVVRNGVSVGSNAVVSLGSRLLAFVKNLHLPTTIPVAGGLSAMLSGLVGLTHKRGGAIPVITEEIIDPPGKKQAKPEVKEEAPKPAPIVPQEAKQEQKVPQKVQPIIIHPSQSALQTDASDPTKDAPAGMYWATKKTTTTTPEGSVIVEEKKVLEPLPTEKKTEISAQTIITATADDEPSEVEATEPATSAEEEEQDHEIHKATPIKVAPAATNGGSAQELSSVLDKENDQPQINTPPMSTPESATSAATSVPTPEAPAGETNTVKPGNDITESIPQPEMIPHAQPEEHTATEVNNPTQVAGEGFTMTPSPNNNGI